MTKLNVILPAAGKGSRLNLPYPKEILRFDNDKALIDCSLDLFSAAKRTEVQFTVVIDESKTEIVKYLAKYKNCYDFNFVFQKPDEIEYTGAIKSAKHTFLHQNLVLLPDTVLKLKSPNKLLEQVRSVLLRQNFVFLAKKSQEHSLLRTKGCLSLNELDRVEAYYDKPQTGLERFNAYWCAFAFTPKIFDEALSFMELSTLRQSAPELSFGCPSLYNSEIIEVENFLDLGTWDQLRRYITENTV